MNARLMRHKNISSTEYKRNATYYMDDNTEHQSVIE